MHFDLRLAKISGACEVVAEAETRAVDGIICHGHDSEASLMRSKWRHVESRVNPAAHHDGRIPLFTPNFATVLNPRGAMEFVCQHM